MAGATPAVRARPLLVRFTPQMVVLVLLGAAAAAWTVVRADGMWDSPGTMGYGLPAFMAMWALMMSAMMLPSVAPFASTYARTVKTRRTARLMLFAAGYLLVWSLVGLPAYGLAWVADRNAGETGGTVLAAVVFAAAGIYQLTPLKFRCLSHCRSPMGHLLHFAAYRGPLRDLRAGFEHGYFCAACCWGLMALLVAFGVMNVPAMIGLAAVVALEKLWPRGELVSRGVGALALVAAVAVFRVPGLAPGLTSEPMDMAAMSMERGMAAEDGTAATDMPGGSKTGSPMGGRMEK